MTSYEIEQLFKNQLAIMLDLRNKYSSVLKRLDDPIKETKEMLETLKTQRELGRD